MKTIIPVRGKQITVQLAQHAVRITTDRELKTLLRKDVRKATAELVSLVKSEYQNAFNATFKVSDRSMSVEIWGHAYADEVATWIQKHARLAPVAKITDRIIYHARLIDIGERGHDNNRFFWDGLAHIESLIAFFLP